MIECVCVCVGNRKGYQASVGERERARGEHVTKAKKRDADG